MATKTKDPAKEKEAPQDQDQQGEVASKIVPRESRTREEEAEEFLRESRRNHAAAVEIWNYSETISAFAHQAASESARPKRAVLLTAVSGLAFAVGALALDIEASTLPA